MPFRVLALLTGSVCATLATALLFIPDILLSIFAVTPTAEAAFVARRTAMLFVGYAVLSFALSGTIDPTVRRSFALAMLVSMAGLAILGLTEFLRGFAGPGIFVAILTEAFFAITWWLRWRRPD